MLYHADIAPLAADNLKERSAEHYLTIEELQFIRALIDAVRKDRSMWRKYGYYDPVETDYFYEQPIRDALWFGMAFDVGISEHGPTIFIRALHIAYKM